MAAIQALVLATLLLTFRKSAIFKGGFGDEVLALSLVSWSAVGLGLTISAGAKWAASKPLAQFVFPLVMMLQIVLSIEIAGTSKGSLQEAYGKFSYAHCQGVKGCPGPVEDWQPELA